MKRALTLLIALATVFTAAQAQDAKAGEKKIANCVGCHGIVGYQASFPQVYKVPYLAGQSAKYIASALTQYRSGDRRHPTMRAQAMSLSDADIADIAAYYEALGKSVVTAPVPAMLESPVPDALKAKVASCAACHGANFTTPTDPSIPRLAGQHADYLYFALKAYQTTGNPNYGRANATMNGMSATLSDADMKAVASYFASLPSELKIVPESRFAAATKR